MPLPLLPLLLIGSAIGGSLYGGKKAVDGVSDINRARRIAETAKSNYEYAVKTLDFKKTQVNRNLRAYGDILLGIRRNTFGRFVKFVESLDQRGSLEAVKTLEKVNIYPPQIREYQVASIEAHEVATGAVTAVASGLGASAGTTGLVSLFGTASTGTAISSLSGAAATNATLAWLGGGALTAGGGGMALGTVVLGGITIAPAMVIGGFVLASRGQKAVTEAMEYQSKVGRETHKRNSLKHFLDRVIIRINELKKLLTSINYRANKALDLLNPVRFDVHNENDVRAFQRAGLLIMALAEIMKTPVLDDRGDLTSESCQVQLKYKELTE